MDNHPIPQDVTGFQFRLIGNMTVKQFAYVAVGAVAAVILYYIPLFILIKVVLIPLFIITGIALAFLPIEGRPIDVMVSHFIKAVFAPTQFLYKKKGGQLPISAIHVSQKTVTDAATATASGSPIQRQTQEQKQRERQQKLASYLTTLQQSQTPEDQEAGRLSALFGPTPVSAVQNSPVNASAQLTEPQPLPQQPQVTPVMQPPIPVQSQEGSTPPPPPVATVPAGTDTAVLIQKDTEQIAQDETLINQVSAELTKAKAEEQTGGNQEAHATVINLEQKLQEILAAKQKLEEELQALRSTKERTVQVPQIPVVQQPAAPVTPPVQAATAAPASTSGFPSIPDSPNMLLGVVRDSSGNVLPHILVEVKDAEENPVRAFKTNQLGQFLSATPLKEGTYTIHLEDTKNQYKFDAATVTINNQIMQPLEFSAHDLREELRKSLFA